MNKSKAIEVLESVKVQFETSINDADMGDVMAIEANDDNKEVVEALNIAIKYLSK